MTNWSNSLPVANAAGRALLIASALVAGGTAPASPQRAAKKDVVPVRPQPAPRPAPGPSNSQGTLRLIQYNVQFLCPLDGNLGPICGAIAGDHWPNTGERARAIGEKLASFDIVALQETINGDRRCELRAAMERAAASGGRPSLLPAGTASQCNRERLPASRYFDGETGPTLDGGNPLQRTVDNEVTLFSRLPITRRTEHVYRNKCGDDAAAAKGVVHVRLDGRGRSGRRTPMDVFATHLQAGGRGCENVSRVKRAQVAELVAFIRAHRSPSGVTLVMGDFNIDGARPVRDCRDSDYGYLSRQLAQFGLRDIGTSLGGTNEERLLRPEPTPSPSLVCQTRWRRPERIDYIFVGPATVQASGTRIADGDFLRTAPLLAGTYSSEVADAFNAKPYRNGFPYAVCDRTPAATRRCEFLTFADHAPVVTTITIP